MAFRQIANSLKLFNAPLPQKQSKRLFSQTLPLNRLENVLIIGSGLMGSGIAQSCATTGNFNSITLQDVSQEQLGKAQKQIHKNMSRLKEAKRSKIHFELFFFYF